MDVPSTRMDGDKTVYPRGVKQNPSGQTFAVAALFMLALLWTYALGWALSGYPIYRDQHMGTAIAYARDGIDLLRPVIVGFNANGSGTPQEFPVWQATAAVGLKMFGGWWGGATIASLLLFTVFLPCFWQTAKWELEPASAWLAIAVLLAQPIVFHLAGGAQTDGLSLALLLGFVWSAESLRRSRSAPRWLVCSTFAAMLAVTKLPYLMVGGLASAVVLFWNKENPRSWVSLAGAGAVAAIALAVWTSWCNAEIGRALFKYRPLTISENPEWFFGSLAYRLDPANYIKAGWRGLGCLWGSFVLVGLTVYGAWLRPKSLGTALLLAATATTLVFTKLVLIHKHYFLMFAPAIALLNSYALSDIWLRARRGPTNREALAAGASICILLGLSLVQGLVQIEALTLTADPHMKTVAKEVADHTSPGDRLVVINGGFGGDLLILAGRDGVSADSPDIANRIESGKTLQSLGYDKIVMVSESPLLHAAQLTNPGSSDLVRVDWTSFATADSERWPELYRSDNVIIKELPVNPHNNP